MQDRASNNVEPHPFLLRNLSIRQQLPMLICLLLLILIFLFGTISYLGIRRATMAIGETRLRRLTGQLSSMLEQQAHTMASATQTIAGKAEIRRFLAPDARNAPRPGEALEALNHLLADSQTVAVDLRDLQGSVVLHAGRRLRTAAAAESGNLHFIPAAAAEVRGKSDSNFIGKFYFAGDSMYYPAIATVIQEGKPVGYLYRWRTVRTTPKALAQLTQLMGSEAALFVGNTDGTLWTDMLKPVAAPPAVSKNPANPVSYTRPRGRVIADAMNIPGTKWRVVVELSTDQVLEAANRFLFWMIVIGLLLVLTGSFIAWRISRSFTRPLDRLMQATAAIEAGDYSPAVVTDRRDEIGRLARSFNSMAAQVRHAHEELENKVSLRTRELETVNKELEAFSYSVSHDLRAPLRAVSGYAMMLKEDYEATFDDEAKRITGNILSNVKMMGRLIDDLIAFSRLGKREVRRQTTDMQALTDTCVRELKEVWPEDRFLVCVDPLPPCRGDEDLLKQVWLNLIGNAMKYSSKTPHPRITVGATENGKGTVYFVRDNGAGFDMRYADKLFKVFQRLHSQEEFEGTGVGLALVKRILDKHGGEIWAESTPGAGAVFYFRLPA
ncbi:MAG TPA: ATP-binding protein [Puia sp.]|nr:ATP-binding protein [Puia sp.]